MWRRIRRRRSRRRSKMDSADFKITTHQVFTKMLLHVGMGANHGEHGGG